MSDKEKRLVEKAARKAEREKKRAEKAARKTEKAKKADKKVPDPPPEEDPETSNETQDVKQSRSEILSQIKDIPEEDRTKCQSEYIILEEMKVSLEKQLKNVKALLRSAATNAVKESKKKNKPKTDRKKTGFSQEYQLPEDIMKIVKDLEIHDYKDGKVTAPNLVDACKNFQGSNHISLEEDDVVNKIFCDYLAELDDNIDDKYKPSKKSLAADRSNLTRIQMISYTCAFLKWCNKD
jgi:hypothetical protein